MLIREKLPQGHIYPQITHAPNTYADFLNYFRGGHTIDDNLGATSIAAMVQARMLEIAIASGHLTKTKNMAMPNEFLADISLTKAGAELIQTVLDRTLCEAAIAEARKSIAENDGDLHPCVGAVVVKDGKVIARACRGETGEGRHAEFCALKKINDNVDNVDLSGKVARVVYGMADKHESVYGHSSLVEAGIEIGFFPNDLMQELLILNKEWSDSLRLKQGFPPPNTTSPIANVSYYKPGTSMADNTHMFVRPPKEAGGFFTVEDADKNVLAYGRTPEETAIEWHRIDDNKVIVQKLVRQSYGSSNRLFSFI